MGAGKSYNLKNHDYRKELSKAVPSFTAVSKCKYCKVKRYFPIDRLDDHEKLHSISEKLKHFIINIFIKDKETKLRFVPTNQND